MPVCWSWGRTAARQSSAALPLAFANAVPAGDIGVIGASGTGIQEITTLIARGGGGVSHAIGVGGRDLSAAVGGLSTFAALDALDRDPATRTIVLVSKPPAAEVTARLTARLSRTDKAVVLCLVGGGAHARLASPVKPAASLKQAAELALGRDSRRFKGNGAARPARPGRITGLFAGGTLAAETQAILLAAGEPVASNAPVPGATALTEDADETCHRLLDLGDDRFTRGRPHPMIDPEVRDAPLAEALADKIHRYRPARSRHRLTAQHRTPQVTWQKCLSSRPQDGRLVIASVTGTDADPQVRSPPSRRRSRPPVSLVAPSSADAARAGARVSRARFRRTGVMTR